MLFPFTLFAHHLFHQFVHLVSPLKITSLFTEVFSRTKGLCQAQIVVSLGREKPNQNYYDHNAGAVPDQGQGQFVMPVVPPQHGYQRYQQPYQQQYQHQLYQHYQPHTHAPLYKQHSQPPRPYGGYAQQDYGHLLHMLNQSYQYRAPKKQYMENDTVTFPQSSQPPMAAPAPAEKRTRKLFETVDPNNKKAVEVTPLQAPTAPVIPAVPLGPEEEKKKAELSRELTEQVRRRLTSTNSDDGHQSTSPNLQGSSPLPNFSQPPPSISSSPPVAEVVKLAPRTADAHTKVETGAPPAEPVNFPQPSQPPMTAPAPAEKRENATRQDYGHQHPIQKKPTSSTKDQLMELVLSMRHDIVDLQNQNAQLITEVRTLTNSFADLKKAMEGVPTTEETFAEMLNKCLSAPSAQVTIMYAAKLAQKSDYRQSSVIIRGAQLSTDSSQDIDLGRSVAAECNISGNFSVFRISIKESPPLLKIKFKNKMDATKALTSFNSIKNRVTGCHSASIRPDLSKPELAKFRESWKEAIKKNNEAGQRIWTVRNLETVKFPYEHGQSPHPWIVRNQIE